jgi:hypothetical protein
MDHLKQTSLKPQDIVVCLKLHLEFSAPTIQKLSQALFISAGEVHGALQRAKKSRLISVESGVQRVMQAAFVEFIVHGLKHAFPASTGPIIRGMLTGIAAVPALEQRFAPTESLPFVWPHPEGRVNGISLAPLFPSVPQAAALDAKLYRALALIDAVREGAARERELAIEEIRLMLAK